jgi:hypothetical protein
VIREVNVIYRIKPWLLDLIGVVLPSPGRINEPLRIRTLDL